MGNTTGKFFEKEDEEVNVVRLPRSTEILLKPLIDRYQGWFNDEKNKSFMMPVGDRYMKIFEETDNNSLKLEETLERLGYRLERVYQDIENVDKTSDGEETEIRELRDVKEMYLTLAGYYEENELSV